MSYSSLESSHRDESNGSKIAFSDIIERYLSHNKYLIFFINNVLYIELIDMILLPFNSPRWDDSNEL